MPTPILNVRYISGHSTPPHSWSNLKIGGIFHTDVSISTPKPSGNAPHRKELSRFKTVEAFDKGFHVTDAMFAELVKLADGKGIKGTEEQKKVARQEADILLKAYIARNLFDDEGFYPIYAPMDEVLQKALEVMESEP